jgi:hypothetical protein
VAAAIEAPVDAAWTRLRRGCYLGVEDGERFAAERRSRPGVLLRLVPDGPRRWALSSILPS